MACVLMGHEPAIKNGGGLKPALLREPAVYPRGRGPAPRQRLLVRRLAPVLLAAIALTGCGGSSPVPAVDGSAWGPQTDDVTPPVASRPIVKVPLTPCPVSLPPTAPSGRDRLPALTLQCFGRGPAVAMATGHGVPTVVNLWASWCVPCRSEMPRLRASAARLGSRAGFLGVDIKDDPGSAWKFLADMRVHYPNVADPKAAMLAALHVPGVPITYVVDSDGKVVFRHIGELHESDIAEVEAAVRGTR